MNNLSHKKNNHQRWLFSWCAMRDLNPHGRPLDPKSSASANSANRAYGDSTENRTRVTAVKGRCLDRLTMEPYFK